MERYGMYGKRKLNKHTTRYFGSGQLKFDLYSVLFKPLKLFDLYDFIQRFYQISIEGKEILLPLLNFCSQVIQFQQMAKIAKGQFIFGEDLGADFL
jgi:hypothetical protein